MKYQPCAIFDADDTLWKTQELFSAAIDQFEKLMYMQGFNPREAHDTMMEINVALAYQYGMRVNNFSDAMVQTYDRFCKGLGTYYSREVARDLRVIGLLPYSSDVELYDGVRETIETLGGRGYRLILCTSGSPSVQYDKLEKSGLYGFFERIYVVSCKTSEVFTNIVTDCGLVHAYTYMVGNSARSDINPASAAGLRCFWLDQGAWAYDAEPLAHPWRVYRINKISDVLDYLCTQPLSA